MSIDEKLHTLARAGKRSAMAMLQAVKAYGATGESNWRRRRLAILCYHGVSLADEHEWIPELFVTTDFLRRRFEILSSNGFNVLDLGDAYTKLKNGSLPPKSIVLTFDDGFYNFLHSAVPLLEEFGFPATNYVSTYYVQAQRPILPLAMRYVVWRARNQIIPAGTFAEQSRPINLQLDAERSAFVDCMIEKAEGLGDDREAQSDWVAEFCARLNVDWEQIMSSRILHLMSPDELSQLANRGFDIQLHTHRHRTPRDKEAFIGEIVENRRILESCTGREAAHFCYPSGDWDQVFFPWLREAGVETATTGIPRLARATDEPLLLPRYVDTMLQPETVFEGWLCGVVDLIDSLRR